MKLSIRTGYNLKVVLDKLQKISVINEDGKIAFIGFEYQVYRRLLSHLISFPDSAKHTNTESLVITTFKKCLLSEDLSEKNFLEELKTELKDKLSMPEKTYFLLTSINLDTRDIQNKGWSCLDCDIEFFVGAYPKKYTEREKVINELGRDFAKDSTPLGYTRVVVTVRSRSQKEAMNRGLDALNLFRALSCLETNAIGFIAGDLYKPINKIRLGKVHTLHEKDGLALAYPVYFEPTFKKVNMERPKDVVLFENNLKFYFEKIKSKQFSTDLENALLRCVDALDESDNNVAVTKLWGALESLVVQGLSNCDLMPTRLAARYADFELTKQIVMHIREYRNTLIHKGVKDDESIYRAYHLQKFFHDIFLFYLSKHHKFKSIDEANKFLDKAALGKEKLMAELETIQKALKYVTPKEPQ